MYRIFTAILFCILACTGYAQYYVHGEIRDEHDVRINNARIYLSSKGNYPYSSGSQGSFGIPINVKTDTIIILMDGYDTCIQTIEANKYQVLQLKKHISPTTRITKRLASLNQNAIELNQKISFHNGETYNNLIENPWIKTLSYPENGFSLNIDNASYSNIRRFINQQSIVPVNAVRIEEMLNYFNLKQNTGDSSDHQFSCHTSITQAPWNKSNLLYYINIQAPKLNLDSIPPSKLVFLIDISGSMDRPNRLPLIQSALKLLTTNLRERDTISIVAYGGFVGIVLPPTSGNEKDKINQIIERLTANGDTPGEAALRLAYELAEKNYNSTSNNRVIIATDGDFNVGQTSEEDLEKLISQHTQSGIYLTCLGVGMGNYKDSKLEAMARKGNGNFAYIDNVKEAEKILLNEFTKTMYSVADNASMKVNFNPGIVKQYRLIGFDNRSDALADSMKQLEGGEIGSGHTLMAVYEIEPTEECKTAIEFGNTNHLPNKVDIASLTLQYKQPVSKQITIQHFDNTAFYTPLVSCDSVFRFAASIVMFGELLKNSPYAINYSWKELIQFTNTTINQQDASQKEFLELLIKARKFYPKRVKKDLKRSLPL